MTKRKIDTTRFSEFYRKVVWPQIAGKSQSTREQHDACEAAVRHWRPFATIEEIDSDWMKAFEENLVELDVKPTWQQVLLRNVKRIVRFKYPDRFMFKAAWDQLLPFFLAEPPDHLGHFFVKCHGEFDRKGDNYKHAVRRYYQWSEHCPKLISINDSLLDKFEQAERSRGCSGETAQNTRQHLARIVNQWKPGRIRSRSLQALPATAREGSLQQFVEAKFIPETGAKGRELREIRVVMNRLAQFRGGKSLPMRQLTPELGEQYLNWARSSGNNGEALSIHRVNNDRWILNRISCVAVELGAAKRPLRLEKLQQSHGRKRSLIYKSAGYLQRRETRGKASSRKGGRPAKWEHLKACLATYLREEPSARPADLRARYKLEHPTRPLPNPRSTTLRAFISLIRTSQQLMQKST